MQGSIKGKTQWLYADPKVKRDFLQRSRAKASELYRLLLDVEAKEGVMAATCGPSYATLLSSSSSSLMKPSASAPSPQQQSQKSIYVDPAISGLLQCVGTEDNLHKLFVSAQRWMWSVDRVYARLLRNIDMYAPISKGHRKWVSAEVFPTHPVEVAAMDINSKVTVLMDHALNGTASQIPSPWLYVARESTEASKTAAIVDGTQGEYNTDRINTLKDTVGKRAALPEDSMLTKRLSNDQQLDFMQNLPYRQCATDDSGETKMGKFQKRPRRRGTSEQRASRSNAQRVEGLPLAKDGSVTTASCRVHIDTSTMTPYERLHAIAITNAFVLNALYFEGRAVSVTTTSVELATFLETVFGEFLDEQFLAVELVTLKGGEEGEAAGWMQGTSLAASSVWAVPEGVTDSSQKMWSAAECEAVLLKAATTDCRSIVVPKAWKGAGALREAADRLKERLAKQQQQQQNGGPSSASSPHFVIPSLYPADTPVAQLLRDTLHVPYVTLVSTDAVAARRVAMGRSIGGAGGGTSTNDPLNDYDGLPSAVKVVGVNAIAADTPLFFPGALSPVVGRGWQSTSSHEPIASIGNSHRFEAVGRSIVERPWESTVQKGAKKLIATYDAASTPLGMVSPPSSSSLVSERLCNALAAGFSPQTAVALASAKILRF